MYYFSPGPSQALVVYRRFSENAKRWPRNCGSRVIARGALCIAAPRRDNSASGTAIAGEWCWRISAGIACCGLACNCALCSGRGRECILGWWIFRCLAGLICGWWDYFCIFLFARDECLYFGDCSCKLGLDARYFTFKWKQDFLRIIYRLFNVDVEYSLGSILYNYVIMLEIRM